LFDITNINKAEFEFKTNFNPMPKSNFNPMPKSNFNPITNDFYHKQIVIIFYLFIACALCFVGVMCRIGDNIVGVLGALMLALMCRIGGVNVDVIVSYWGR